VLVISNNHWLYKLYRSNKNSNVRGLLRETPRKCHPSMSRYLRLNSKRLILMATSSTHYVLLHPLTWIPSQIHFRGMIKVPCYDPIRMCILRVKKKASNNFIRKELSRFKNRNHLWTSSRPTSIFTKKRLKNNLPGVPKRMDQVVAWDRRGMMLWP